MTPDPWMADRLRRFFTRKFDGFGARSSGLYTSFLAEPYRDGRLRVAMSHLPLAACEDAAERPLRGERGESVEHMRMKYAARAWMRAGGASDAACEVRGYDGRFDAYSAAHRWIVECGNTNVDKLVDAICDEDQPRFTLIPWQKVDRRDGSPRRLVAADFQWDRALSDELNDAITGRMLAATLGDEKAERQRRIAEAQARKAERDASALPCSSRETE